MVTNVAVEFKITMYAKPASIQCAGTFKALDKTGLAYDVVDISLDTKARDYVMSLGYLQAPVTIAYWKIGDTKLPPSMHWSGFRPDRIEWLVKEYRQNCESLRQILESDRVSALAAVVS